MDFLHSFTQDNINELTNYILNDNKLAMLANVENWEELYKKLIDADVATQGFLYHYFQLLDMNILEYDDRIREGAFLDDKSLKSIEIPKNITEIGVEAFKQSSLTNITIPSSVTTIRYRAFG